MRTIPFDGIRLVMMLLPVFWLPITAIAAESLENDIRNVDASEERHLVETRTPESTSGPGQNVLRFREQGSNANGEFVAHQDLLKLDMAANHHKRLDDTIPYSTDPFIDGDTEPGALPITMTTQTSNPPSGRPAETSIALRNRLENSSRPVPVYSDTFSGSIATVADSWDGGGFVGDVPVVSADESYCGSEENDCEYYFSRFRNARHGYSFWDNRRPNWGGVPSGCADSCKWGIETGWLVDQGPLGFQMEGWVAQSFTANASAPKVSRFNGPVTFVDRPNTYLLNQIYTVLKRDTHTSPCSPLDLGGRVDMLYGTDARFTIARGLDDDLISDRDSRFYKLSFPQMYAEAGVCDWKLQLGRFYTIVGYETVTAPDNFFVSHSYTMQYGEPFTHTGFLATGHVSEDFILSLGVTRGWNVWEDHNGDADFLGGLAWTCPDSPTTLSFAVTSGPQDDLGSQDRVLLSAVLQHEFCPNWNYVFHGDYAYENDAATDRRDAEWYGIVNYLTYDVNDCWSLGIRQEWFSDDDGVRVEGIGAPSGIDLELVPGNWQDISLGVNYRPGDRCVVRSEARWDWFSPLASTTFSPFDDGTSRSQFLWTIDLIVGF